MLRKRLKPNTTYVRNGYEYATDAFGHIEKGLQTAGGNKVVMQDAAGAQKITISNSNNKGSAIEVNFAGDGSISIQSRGPVTITGANVTVAAGPPAKGATAYTGEIKLLAKTITMEAEEEVAVTSKKKSVTVKAKDKAVLEAKMRWSS